ncbi:protein Brevis radix-like 1 [Iris pallida]|uniref:Protein Brevis radix-like 1 n=1 Tax=Iris pallida TaxID=29817 RepID=A0AAX6IF69_IRIPA|nr:protein Brevis radix-like 1 [Iris pallida]KAJ6851718.1 protein Brevis radix-like 1 [Iris pallida]
MFTCIACSKHLAAGAGSLPDAADAGDTPSTRHAIKAFAAQLKEMATKASGAYRHCRPCSGSAESARRSHHHQRRHSSFADSDSAAMGSDPIQCGYRRAGESFGSASSMSGKTDEEEPAGEGEERKEWVAQVEPGVLITFLAVAEDGNDLKRIRFSRDMFNKWQAQRWWAENYDKVMELYNVQKFNRLAGPLPTPPRSEDESSKMESAEESPPTPPLSKEGLSRKFHRSMTGRGTGYSSPDSLDQQPAAHHDIRLNGMDGRHCYDSGAPTSTPELSSTSGMRTETSSVDAASIRTSSEADRSGELSASAVSNTSEQEKEWVEQDEPGVYITIRAMPGGTRELRRVRFSRERFGEMHARLWWEENRARINEQYL